MPELGQTLRRARLDRGLAFEDVAATTKIRSKYLAALEDEELDVFPGHVYARGFLRGYAQFLGIEPQPLLDELDARSPESDSDGLSLELIPMPSQPRHGRTLTILAVAAVALLVALLAWPRERDPAVPESRGTRATAALVRPPSNKRPQPVGPLRVVLVAARGDCWLAARDGSEMGPLVYEGLLATGRSLRFRRDLWIRLGAPWNVDLRVNGLARSLPPSTKPINVLVTSKGARSV